jgi:uncharacterized protein YqgV (UPF0045/DUF77 family)
MKNHKINLAVQVLPSSNDKHPYDIVDKAIEYIQSTGIKHEVCPFETVLEGEYREIMDTVEKIQDVCYAAGATGLLVNMKIQSRQDGDVTIEEKTGKYK